MGETRKIKVWVETGFANGQHHGEIEVPVDATDDEIDEEVREWMFNKISYGWEDA